MITLDLNYYSLIVKWIYFEDIDTDMINKLNIDELKLENLCSVLNGNDLLGTQDKDTFDIRQHCMNVADLLCLKWSIDSKYVPLYKEFIIPYCVEPKDEIEADNIIKCLENCCSIEVDNNSAEWYVREDLKYRLLAMYTKQFDKYLEKTKALLDDTIPNEEKFKSWQHRKTIKE